MYSPGFIGRSRELAFLESRAADLPARGGCVCVCGEAGIGKTRLINEFSQRLSVTGVRVVTGWTREYANAPYAPFTEALETLQVDALPAPLSVRDADRTAWFEEVAQALRKAVEDQPSGVVVVLEDLHWTDPGTIDLLRFCASRLADAAILFVASYRIDEYDQSASDLGPTFAGIERDADVITLRPLAPDQIERLLNDVAERAGREITPQLVADVRNLAEGRPFLAEELLRGLFRCLDRGERVIPTIPSSVRATVGERIAALDTASRELLLQASLIGSRFSAKRLAQLAGVEPAQTLGAMRRCRELGLIVEVAEDEFGDTLAFRHALTREAVYAEMDVALARLGHARFAKLLLDEPTVDVAAVAEHTWQAGDGERAATWNERAGDDAATYFAFLEAVRAYERAHDSSTDSVKRARIAEKAADAAYQSGDLLVTARWFGAAAAALRDLGNDALAVRLSLRRARVLNEAGRFEEGLREAKSIVVPDEEPAQRFEVETMIGGMLLGQGRSEEALERLRDAERHKRFGDAAIAIRFSASYALALSLLGPSSEARARYAETLASAESIGDLDMLPRTYNNWANLELTWGAVSQARALYARGLTIADEMRSARHIVWLLANAAIAGVLAGALQQSRADLERAEEFEHGIPLIHVWCLATRVRISTLLGEDSNDLAERASRVLERAAASEDPRGLILLAAALAYRAASFGNLDEAARFVTMADAGIESSLAPFWLLDCALRFGTPDQRRRAHLRLGEIAGRDGALAARGFLDLDAAREAVRQRHRDDATRQAEAAAANFAAAGWLLDEAFALEAAGRVPEALARFREMGATGEVRRLTELTSTARRRGDGTLTAREREITRMLLDGQSAKVIADALTISERTVETHVAAIYRKLGVRNRAELNGAVRAD
jgi:DNA-binding CsgD family transcriptional regulator/tetratricopeptide (TPR) repeat protein